MPAFWGGTSCQTATTTCNTVYVTVATGTSSCTAPTYYYYGNQAANIALYQGYQNASSGYYYDDPATRQAAITKSHSAEAKQRALDLLLEHLTSEQKNTFNEKKWFVVEGGKSKTQYRIRARDDLVANIDIVDGSKTKHRLCGHCDLKKVPLGDQLLAQKMMLEFAEDDFLRIANKHAA